jgi:hypothetical protein
MAANVVPPACDAFTGLYLPSSWSRYAPIPARERPSDDVSAGRHRSGRRKRTRTDSEVVLGGLENTPGDRAEADPAAVGGGGGGGDRDLVAVLEEGSH